MRILEFCYNIFMSLNIKTTTEAGEVADFVATSILKQLESGKVVLFFVTGGSSILVGIKVAEILKNHQCENLTIILTDERYGPLGHKDSNWQQLLDGGFVFPQAKLIPVLSGDGQKSTTEKFNQNLIQEFERAEYKIGLFGIGSDGHIAGILPDSDAVTMQDLACGYETPSFIRITITPKAIEKLDEAVVFMQRESKWSVLEDLEKDIEITKQPAQILKKVPSLTIFTDYQNSRINSSGDIFKNEQR